MGAYDFYRDCMLFLRMQILICRIAYLPRDVNIIRYVKGSRNTARGHNDFCSVRLNGPICAKVSCPSSCCRIIKAYRIANPR